MLIWRKTLFQTSIYPNFNVTNKTVLYESLKLAAHKEEASPFKRHPYPIPCPLI
jgi:hypothetical protein